MCLIIDANVISLVLSPKPDEDFQPVWNALFKKTATAVHGGRLTREYEKLRRLLQLIQELDRQGVLRKIADDKVDAETKALRKEKTCVSDDPHIIALARVANVRLLCSRDKKLHIDFTNTKILKPKGSVYQKKSHRPLIRKHCGKKK